MVFAVRRPPDILFRYGEVFLKGKNVKFLEKILINNIYATAELFGVSRNKFLVEIVQRRGHIYAENSIVVHKLLGDVLPFVSGVAWFGGVEWDVYDNTISLTNVLNRILEVLSRKKINLRNYKLEVKRYNKKLNFTSQDLFIALKKYLQGDQKGGRIILEESRQAREGIGKLLIILDDRRFGIVFVRRGLYGIPISASGRGIVLLSGGIDSPVAAYLMGLRGVNYDLLHLHPPNVSIRDSKIYDIYTVLKKYNPYARLYTTTLTGFGKLVQAKKIYNPIVIYRRAIIRLAYQLGKKLYKRKQFLIITGDSLSQVASQTVSNLIVTSEMMCDLSKTDALIVRPLIGMSKDTIMSLARQIGTYNYSIQEYKDCCSLLNINSKTESSLQRIKQAEQDNDIKTLVNKALKEVEHIK